MINIIDSLKEKGIKFTHSIPSRAAFIMEDGLFLGIEDNQEVIMGGRIYPTHDDFYYFLIKNHLSTDEWKNLKTIKLNDGSINYTYEIAYLRIKDAITEQQIETVKRWLDNLCFNIGKRRMILEVNGNITEYRLANKDNLNGMLPEDIIKDIKRTYKKDSV